MKRCGKGIALFVFLGIWINALAQDTLLTVQDAMKMAVEKNFDVRISKNEIEIGTINNSWGMAGALPTISATATKTFGSNNLKQKLSNGTVTEKKGSTTQNFAAGFEVNWRVFDGFRMFATKRKLEALEQMGEYAFRKTLNETLYDVVTSYYQIVTLKEQLQATEEQIDLYNDRLRLAQLKLEIGTGAKYEVLEAEVDLNEQKSNLLALQNAIWIAKVSLSNLIGRKPDTSFYITDTILIQPLPLLTDVNLKIQQQNPDMLMANTNLAVLHEVKKEINADRLPSVTLNGFYNFNKSSNSAGFNLFNQTYGPSGRIGVSIPIFQGGVVKKQLQVAGIDIRNQHLRIEQAKENIMTALTNAYISFASALKTIELEKKNLVLASENIVIATERYKKLNITAVELRQVQISYNATKYRLFNALNQAKAAEAMVALLSGDIENL